MIRYFPCSLRAAVSGHRDRLQLSRAESLGSNLGRQLESVGNLVTLKVINWCSATLRWSKQIRYLNTYKKSWLITSDQCLSLLVYATTNPQLMRDHVELTGMMDHQPLEHHQPHGVLICWHWRLRISWRVNSDFMNDAPCCWYIYQLMYLWNDPVRTVMPYIMWICWWTAQWIVTKTQSLKPSLFATGSVLDFDYWKFLNLRPHNFPTSCSAVEGFTCGLSWYGAWSGLQLCLFDRIV